MKPEFPLEYGVTRRGGQRLRVLEQRMLRRIFGLKRKKVAGGCIRSSITWYASPVIITVIKSRRMRWTGNVARMGEMGNVYKISVGKPEGKNQSEDLGIDG
jgi:hypothetical protein